MALSKCREDVKSIYVQTQSEVCGCDTVSPELSKGGRCSNKSSAHHHMALLCNENSPSLQSLLLLIPVASALEIV